MTAKRRPAMTAKRLLTLFILLGGLAFAAIRLGLVSPGGGATPANTWSAQIQRDLAEGKLPPPSTCAGQSPYSPCWSELSKIYKAARDTGTIIACNMGDSCQWQWEPGSP
jgi:hypothetical protein